jgi:hypothetical protein
MASCGEDILFKLAVRELWIEKRLGTDMERKLEK